MFALFFSALETMFVRDIVSVHIYRLQIIHVYFLFCYFRMADSLLTYRLKMNIFYNASLRTSSSDGFFKNKLLLCHDSIEGIGDVKYVVNDDYLHIMLTGKGSSLSLF